MNIDICYLDRDHGKIATHPIVLLATRELLFLEGKNLSRRRAYPDASPSAQSGAFN